MVEKIESELGAVIWQINTDPTSPKYVLDILRRFGFPFQLSLDVDAEKVLVMQQKLSKLWQKEVKIARFCSVIKDIPPLNVGDSLPKLPFIQENVVMRWDWFQHLGSNSKTLEKMTEEELSNKEDSESQTFTKLLTQKDPTKVVQFLN